MATPPCLRFEKDFEVLKKLFFMGPLLKFFCSLLPSVNWREKICTNLGTRIWGRRRTPALERTQTGLIFLQQTFCRKWVLSRPWSVYLHRPQPCTGQWMIKNLSVQSCIAVKNLCSPYETCLGSVDEMPPVSCVILPSHVFGVMPQSAHLHKTVNDR